MTANDEAAQVIARELYRRMFPGRIGTPDGKRTPESDQAEMDRAYEVWNEGREGYAPGMICRETTRDILAALADAGFAVVRLPEPTYVDDDAQAYFGEGDLRADPTGSPAYRSVTTDFCMGSEYEVSWSPVRARWWGEHLIAAAEYAEGSHE